MNKAVSRIEPVFFSVTQLIIVVMGVIRHLMITLGRNDGKLIIGTEGMTQRPGRTDFITSVLFFQVSSFSE